MFDRAFIETAGNGKLGHEQTLVRSECERRGLPVELFTVKRIHRRQLPLTRQCFVCGDMTVMQGAARQLGLELPPPDDYPACLTPFLQRRVWRSTVGSIEEQIHAGGREVFAKPAGRAKAFTGRVFSTFDDLRFLGVVSRREAVWCSEVVEWRSEYRVYVVGQDIVSIDHYAGDPAVPLDRAVVEAAASAYRNSGAAPAGHGIDLGVLQDGRTALVEVNDGLALGAYQIAASTYTDLVFARWAELMRG